MKRKERRVRCPACGEEWMTSNNQARCMDTGFEVILEEVKQ